MEGRNRYHSPKRDLKQKKGKSEQISPKRSSTGLEATETSREGTAPLSAEGTATNQMLEGESNRCSCAPRDGWGKLSLLQVIRGSRSPGGGGKETAENQVCTILRRRERKLLAYFLNEPQQNHRARGAPCVHFLKRGGLTKARRIFRRGAGVYLSHRSRE